MRSIIRPLTYYLVRMWESSEYSKEWNDLPETKTKFLLAIVKPVVSKYVLQKKTATTFINALKTTIKCFIF